MAIPNRVRDRVVTGIKRMTPVILQQRTRDVSEADTVTLVKDLLADVFGYDKYAELTGEHAIRGTYCDLAIRIEDKFIKLIEVKAVGVTLDDRHVKQVIDYAANQGVEWVILTNAAVWRLYQVIFGKPIDKRLLVEVDLTTLDVKNEADLDALYLFTKEGFAKGAHLELRDRQDATSRYLLAALLQHNQNVIGSIRRELRRVVDVLVDDAAIAKVLRDEVIKRDALEGPAAEAAVKRVEKVSRAEAKSSRPRTPKSPDGREGDGETALESTQPLAPSDALGGDSQAE